MLRMLHHTPAPGLKVRPNVLHATRLTGGPGSLKLFQQIDVQLPTGVSALTGDEGVGKTSLMRLLAGDLVATEGQISVLGQPVLLPKPQPASVFWLDLRLPQHDDETPEAYWENLRRHLPAWSTETQRQLITSLQLPPHLDKRLNMLSTGSRRKVGLVAALASGAVVTLLDQPFASLDLASIRVIQDALNKLSHEPDRAWLIADYESPTHVHLASVISLDNRVITSQVTPFK